MGSASLAVALEKNSMIVLIVYKANANAISSVCIASRALVHRRFHQWGTAVLGFHTVDVYMFAFSRSDRWST